MSVLLDWLEALSRSLTR